MLRVIRSNPHWRAIRLDSAKAIREAATLTEGFIIKDGNRFEGIAFTNARLSPTVQVWRDEWVVYNGDTFERMTHDDFCRHWEIVE